MIKITKNPDSDTRTASQDVTLERFHKANNLHRDEVNNVMRELAMKVMDAGENHDWTKSEYEAEYFRCFKSTLEKGTDFVSDDWYQRHIHEEKHHPTSFCHDDINLINIMECISDVVVATLARTGEAKMIELPPEILQKAYENTITLIKSMVQLDE